VAISKRKLGCKCTCHTNNWRLSGYGSHADCINCTSFLRFEPKVRKFLERTFKPSVAPILGRSTLPTFMRSRTAPNGPELLRLATHSSLLEVRKSDSMRRSVGLRLGQRAGSPGSIGRSLRP